MSKKKKNKGSAVAKVTAEAKKKPNVWLVASVAAATVVIAGVYFFMMNTPYYLPVLISYLAALSLLLVSYIIYNRGFAMNNVTEDMLPRGMSAEDKRALIADAAERKRRSRWMLVLIFPLIITFGIEALSWFFTDNILPMFKR